nr:MAG TPA: 50S ribosomal subunit [Caudoviricetes sp.]
MGIKVKMNFDKGNLESAIKNKTKEVLQNRSYDVKCPHCHNSFSAQSGINTCPHCHNTVDLTLNIKL